jgi:anti-sigma factor RsiW
VTCSVIDRELDAYIDGELEHAASLLVREHLTTCPACIRRVADRRKLGRLLRASPYDAAPPRLRAQVMRHVRRGLYTRRLVTWAAAAVVIVSLGGGVALLWPPSIADSRIVDDVVSSHVRSLMADHLFDVESTDQHTVKPWFLGRIDFSPPVVDLASSGFPLIGGRLDYLGERPAAALVYRRQNHTINLFVSPAHGGLADAAVNEDSVRGFHVRHWIHDGMEFWAVSDVNDTDLTRFARALEAP